MKTASVLPCFCLRAFTRIFVLLRSKNLLRAAFPFARDHHGSAAVVMVLSVKEQRSDDSLR